MKTFPVCYISIWVHMWLAGKADCTHVNKAGLWTGCTMKVGKWSWLLGFLSSPMDFTAWVSLLIFSVCTMGFFKIVKKCILNTSVFRKTCNQRPHLPPHFFCLSQQKGLINVNKFRELNLLFFMRRKKMDHNTKRKELD